MITVIDDVSQLLCWLFRPGYLYALVGDRCSDDDNDDDGDDGKDDGDDNHI